MIAIRDRRKTLTLNNLLICCIVLWPFFWNVWGIFRLTASIGTLMPLYFLWIVTASMVLANRQIKISFTFIWVLFLCTVAVESISRVGAVIPDLSVILCGALICICMAERTADYKMILKCFYIIGIIVSLSVIIDSAFELFRERLINFYTEQSGSVKMRSTATGGILPHCASAGCYIYSGLAAYVAKIRIEKKKWYQANKWVILLIFFVAVLLIQKRGFIVDTVITVAVIIVLQIRKEEFGKIHIKKLIRRSFILVAIVLAIVFIYSTVPMVQGAFDSLVEKFITEDDTYSGRTDLYELAFSLYSGHMITGIGWGKYRLNTVGFFGLSDTSYAVHNVYIQLLCETGILGLVLFLLSSVSSLIYGIRKYRKILKSEKTIMEKSAVELGIAIQIFFLAYCVSGNPLYDYNFCVTYFIGLMLTMISVRKGA